MATYRVAHRYRAGTYSLEAGAVVDLDDAAAEFLNRDSPGVLVPVTALRDVQEPQANRQVTAPTHRRTKATGEG